MYLVKMLTKSIVILFTFCAVNAAPNFDSRIVNGTEAEDGEFPYVASLQNLGNHYCGVSILNDEWVLTAAHCVYDDEDKPENFIVQYGTVDITIPDNKIAVAEIHIHEDYSPESNIPNDISLLKLKTKIQLGPLAQPVQLPESTDVPGDNPDAVIIGWGYLHSRAKTETHLRKVTITLFNDDICEKELGSIYDKNIQVCAGTPEGGKSSCNGDSGGPLTVNKKVFGLVSWRYTPFCGEPRPTVYTKVTNYREWIRQKTGV